MKKIPILFILPCCLFSCQKEINDIEPTPAVVDSTQLVRIIALDTTLAPGADTATKADYIYDSKNRLSVVGDYLTYSYDNDDTLPSKIVYNYSGYVHFLTYDLNGKVIRDSFFVTDNGFRYTNVYRITNTSNAAVSSVLSYILDLSTGVTTTTDGFADRRQYTYQNDNLTSLLLSASDCTAIGADYDEYSLTYDNHPNPIPPNKYDLVTFMDYQILPVIDFEQKNNCTAFKYTLHSAGTTDVVRSFQVIYKYRSDGYPTEASIIEAPGPYADSEAYNKLIFVYKH